MDSLHFIELRLFSRQYLIATTHTSTSGSNGKVITGEHDGGAAVELVGVELSLEGRRLEVSSGMARQVEVVDRPSHHSLRAEQTKAGRSRGTCVEEVHWSESLLGEVMRSSSQTTAEPQQMLLLFENCGLQMLLLFG